MTPWTVARQAPLSIGFFNQEYCNGLPCSPPGDLPDPGIELGSLKSPALAGGFFSTSATWEAPVRVLQETKVDSSQWPGWGSSYPHFHSSVVDSKQPNALKAADPQTHPSKCPGWKNQMQTHMWAMCVWNYRSEESFNFKQKPLYPEFAMPTANAKRKLQ